MSVSILYADSHLWAQKSMTMTKIDWKVVGRRLRELRGFDTTRQNSPGNWGSVRDSYPDMKRGRVR